MIILQLLSAVADTTGLAVCDPHSGETCNTGLPQVGASSGNLQAILQVTFAILAAVAVLFIVIGGLKFVTSQGQPQEAAKARSTIIFAIVGLVIAIFAEAFVSFVLKRL